MLAGIYKYCGMVAVAIVGISLYFVVDWTGLNKSDWAAWVQAVGSIGAIIGAVWIANDQYRRDSHRRAQEHANESHLLKAELAWLSHDIVIFINQFIDAKSGERCFFVVHDDDVGDFLNRLTWCRQRAEHKGQLAMVGQLRESLMQAVRIVKKREQFPEMRFTDSDVRAFSEARKESLEVSNHSTGGAPVGSRYAE